MRMYHAQAERHLRLCSAAQGLRAARSGKSGGEGGGGGAGWPLLQRSSPNLGMASSRTALRSENGSLELAAATAAADSLPAASASVLALRSVLLRLLLDCELASAPSLVKSIYPT